MTAEAEQQDQPMQSLKLKPLPSATQDIFTTTATSTQQTDVHERWSMTTDAECRVRNLDITFASAVSWSWEMVKTM
jgi:hypothetical protein